MHGGTSVEMFALAHLLSTSFHTLGEVILGNYIHQAMLILL